MEGHKQTRRLLSLDGGGVRGMSTIAILKELMKKLARKRNMAVIHPWQEFDMIGGTSTGGLLAIMLGRLRMSIDQCEGAYARFSQDIFTPQSSTAIGRKRDFITAEGKFSTEALEAYIKELIDAAGLRASEKLEDLRADSPKTFVSAVRRENGAPVVIRSYENPDVYNHLENCKIWEAARATSAASTFFDPITIGNNQETYVDGALGLNNPIRLLDRESRCLWPNDDRVFLSIGTGQASDVNLEGNLSVLASRLKDMVVETEKTAEGFEMDNPDLLERNRYFRFTVREGLKGVGLEEFKARAKIHAATSTYLETVDVMRRVKQFVSVVSVDSLNATNGVGINASSPYSTNPQANASSTYSLAVLPPYSANPTHSNGYGAQASPHVGYGPAIPSGPIYPGAYPLQSHAPPAVTASYSSTIHPTTPSPTSNQPSTPPQRISTPNSSTRNTLTFKQQLLAKKEQANLDKQLMQAVVRNNASLVESLLQKGADVNALGLADCIGHLILVPPIYVAAHQKYNDIIRILLKYNPNVDAVSDNNRKTALLAAIWAQNVDACEELLAAGADPNLDSGAGTPLVEAIKSNDVGILELLVMAGADVNLKAKSLRVRGDLTALGEACERSRAECVRYLVKAGADVEGLENEVHYKFAKQCLAR